LNYILDYYSEITLECPPSSQVYSRRGDQLRTRNSKDAIACRCCKHQQAYLSIRLTTIVPTYTSLKSIIYLQNELNEYRARYKTPELIHSGKGAKRVSRYLNSLSGRLSNGLLVGGSNPSPKPVSAPPAGGLSLPFHFVSGQTSVIHKRTPCRRSFEPACPA
jgi:hypothetical protein